VTYNSDWDYGCVDLVPSDVGYSFITRIRKSISKQNATTTIPEKTYVSIRSITPWC
jgi:hypothetical protein